MWLESGGSYGRNAIRSYMSGNEPDWFRLADGEHDGQSAEPAFCAGSREDGATGLLRSSGTLVALHGLVLALLI